ncbi:hypothetical protein [Azospirillum argentinense]|uniref:hypothetical protein n=1 Tax=Azospirillum argentinense TaxID=2970906 RepID=UPI0032DFA7D3
MRKPDSITFTGLDARTDLVRAVTIARAYPVEFAFLLSPKRQGQEPRYPGGDTLSPIMWSPLISLRLAAHVCGFHSRDIMASGPCRGLPVDLGFCKRVQVNHEAPVAGCIHQFARNWGVRGIAQTREAFPADRRVDWLFDRSAGSGQMPGEWPRHPGGDQLVGYAGGIGPDNVTDVLRLINSDGPYWICMESGVRTDDWLDLDKVEAVCRAVYGEPCHG